MPDQPKHGEKDRVYKQLYSFAEVVEEVVVEIVGKSVGGRWVDNLDFDTLEQMPTEFVDAERETVRLVDMAWRVRFRDRPLWLVLLFEFQSKTDKRMATRALLETALCYQSLAEGRGAGAEGEANAVLFVVVKSFEGRWKGPLSKASELEELVPEELRPFMYGQRVVLLDEEAEAAKGASLDVRTAGCLRAGLALRFERTRSGSRKRCGFGALGHAGVAGRVRRVDSRSDDRLERVGGDDRMAQHAEGGDQGVHEPYRESGAGGRGPGLRRDGEVEVRRGCGGAAGGCAFRRDGPLSAGAAGSAVGRVRDGRRADRQGGWRLANGRRGWLAESQVRQPVPRGAKAYMSGKPMKEN